MKLRILLIIVAFTTMFFSCGKKESSPTGSASLFLRVSGQEKQKILLTPFLFIWPLILKAKFQGADSVSRHLRLKV